MFLDFIGVFFCWILIYNFIFFYLFSYLFHLPLIKQQILNLHWMGKILFCWCFDVFILVLFDFLLKDCPWFSYFYFYQKYDILWRRYSASASLSWYSKFHTTDSVAVAVSIKGILFFVLKQNLVLNLVSMFDGMLMQCPQS